MQSESVLVIAPHADDEILGCGGLIARSVDRGATVTVCVVTSGTAQLFNDDDLKQIRGEALAVHGSIGIARTHFLDFPAPLLDQTPAHAISDALLALITREAPETVLIPHHGDIHHDHSVTYKAALVACRPLALSGLKRILAYETLSETEWAPPRADTWFMPNFYIDITKYVDKKVEAMKGYGSQLREAPHPRSVDGIRALAAHRGLTVGVPAAEAFMLVRQID